MPTRIKWSKVSLLETTNNRGPTDNNVKGVCQHFSPSVFTRAFLSLVQRWIIVSSDILGQVSRWVQSPKSARAEIKIRRKYNGEQAFILPQYFIRQMTDRVLNLAWFFDKAFRTVDDRSQRMKLNTHKGYSTWTSLTHNSFKDTGIIWNLSPAVCYMYEMINLDRPNLH